MRERPPPGISPTAVQPPISPPAAPAPPAAQWAATAAPADEGPLLLPVLPEGYLPSVEEQSALLTFLTSTPLLHRPVLPSLTPSQLAQLLAASRFSLPACLGHLRALVDARRYFPSAAHLTHAITVATRDHSYVSEHERAAITRYLRSPQCRLLSGVGGGEGGGGGWELRDAGVGLDAAFAVCHHNVATLLGFCQRYDTAGLTFDGPRALCQRIVDGTRPVAPLDPHAFHSLLTFLHMPASLTLFSSPPQLSQLTPSSPDVTSLLFEGNGVEGTKASLLRFMSIQRRFGSLQELWPAVHIQWRFGLSSLCEMRTALYEHLTSACPGLVPAANVGHAELELLLTAGCGLHRTKGHCSRLHALQLSFPSVPDLARAFMSTLTLSADEQRLVHGALQQSADALFPAQGEAMVASLAPLHLAWLAYEAGSVSALVSHLAAFTRFHRTFASFFDLLSSVQVAAMSQSYSAPFSLLSLISFYLTAPGLLAPHLPIFSLTGRQHDAVLLDYPIGPLLKHLYQFHALQRSFASIAELAAALQVAFTSGYHTSEAMRRALHAYVASSECALFDNLEDDDMDSTLDVMVEVSGSLQRAFHHLQQLRQLGLRFSHPVKAIPAIRHAVTTGAYSTKAAMTALLAYLTSPECCLLSLQASSSLSSLPPTTVDALLLCGGGLLNTLKHLQRLNTAQTQLPSFSHLTACVRVARRRRLYYSPEQRHALYRYLTSPACHFFDGLTSQVHVTERDMERLFKYGGGVEGTLRVLEELNAAAKRFKSFHHVCAIVKKFATYDARVREVERERSRRRDVTAAERQELVAYLRSPHCGLFSEHPHALRVTAQEVDALVLTAQSSAAALLALRQLNDQGRKCLSMSDLGAAVLALMGPNGVIALTKADRAALLAALSYPQAGIFAGSAGIRLSESDLHSLVYCAGSVERVMREVASFDAVGRRFVTFVDFRAALQVSVEGGLHASQEERAVMREMMTGSCHALFGSRRSEVLQGEDREMEELIRAGRGFIGALYFLQRLEETLQRFDSLAALTAMVAHLAMTEVVPPAFAVLRQSSLSDRYQMFSLLSSPSWQLFRDASDESDLLITPLAFDLFFSRCGGVKRALRVLWGLERMERRFMSFGELIFSTCRVEDGGVGLREVEEYEVGDDDGDVDGEAEAEDDADDSREVEVGDGEGEEEAEAHASSPSGAAGEARRLTSAAAAKAGQKPMQEGPGTAEKGIAVH